MSHINIEGTKPEDFNTGNTENSIDIENTPLTTGDPADLDMDNSITTASQGSEITDDTKLVKSTSETSNPGEDDKVAAIRPDFSFLGNQILPTIDEEEVTATGSYTWVIKNFSKIKEAKVYSPVFTVGDEKFRILLFPLGNASNNIALYLAPNPDTKTVTVNDQTTEIIADPNWYTCAQFTLIASNPQDPKSYVMNTSHQRFTKNTTDWGFSSFTEMKNLTTSRKDGSPLLLDDTLHITAFVKLLHDETGVLWHNFMDYDSKKETGFVGFNNQGATCYLNSLLQSYYFTKSFRNAVYQIPTEDFKPEESVPLALQRIFYQLQRSEDAVDTRELTKSFGWDNYEAFTQHDVQELNRILMDKLESSMAGTSVDSELNDTFVGKMKSYIKCLKVDYESSRTEDFWDIQLNVKNFYNLNESFQDYINTEVLNGENQYSTPDFGMQDAQKGVVFEKFPSVLHLQLKRFEFDFERETLAKVNDRHEFPESIDLSPFLDNEGKTGPLKPCIYDLHGVLIHAGDIANGHYYAMIRPSQDDKWYRFDDDRVWRVTKRQVFEENFGMAAQEIDKMTKLQFQTYQIRRQTNAYMLVYINRDDKSRVLADVNDSDVPEHVRTEMDQELAKRAIEKKDRADQYLYSKIYFYTSSLARKFDGFDVGPHEKYIFYQERDLKPFTLKALKTKLLKDVLPDVGDALGLDINKVKFWAMGYRRNGTLRPTNVLEGIQDITVDNLHQTRFNSKQAALNIWVEDISDSILGEDKSITAKQDNLERTNVEENQKLHDYLVKSQKIMIMIKYFDADSQILKFLSHVRVDSRAPMNKLFETVSGSLGLPMSTEFIIYEELSPNSIQELESKKSFENSEISNGDILIFETKEKHQNPNDFYPFYESAIEFCDYLATRVVANVKMISSGEDDEYVLANTDDEPEAKSFKLVISTKASLDELSKRVAKKINKDPEFIRFFFNFGGNRYGFRSSMTIGLLVSKNVDLNFQYELLSIPLKELENMQTVKINWLPNGVMHSQEIEFSLSKTARVSDLMVKLAAKLNLSDEQSSGLFLWGTFHNKFHVVVYPNYRIDQLSGEYDYYAAIQEDLIEPLKYHTTKTNDAEEEEDEDEENEEDDEEEEEDEEEDMEEETTKIVPVMHFNRDPKRRSHGISFIFGFKRDETLSEGIKRLQVLTGLSSKEFSKIKLCFWDTQKSPVYFRNPIVDPSNEHQQQQVQFNYDAEDNEIDPDTLIPFEQLPEIFLCFDHPDRSTRSTGYAAGGISIR